MKHESTQKDTKAESRGGSQENAAAFQSFGYGNNILRLQSIIGNQAMQRLIQRDETDDRAHALYTEANTLFESGDYAGAYQILQRVAQMPGLADRQYLFMLYNMGQCQLRLNQLHGAESYFRSAVREAESQGNSAVHEAALRALENVRARLGEAASPAAGDSDAAGTTAEGGGETGGPEETAAEALDETEDTRGREIFEQARAAFEAGNYPQAITLYEQVAAMGGLPPDVHVSMLHNMGRAHYELGNYRMAINYLEEFVIRARGAGVEVPNSDMFVLAEAYGHTEVRGEGAEETGTETEGGEGSGDSEARQIFQRAQQAYEAENYGEAAALFRQVYVMPGLPPRIHRAMLRNLGLALYRLGNQVEAIIYLNLYITEQHR